jgi:hypothetical protein
MKYAGFFQTQHEGKEKSNTTYEQYAIIAQNTINLLKTMSQKKKSQYSDEEKLITPSYVKSVLIGLGDKYKLISAELNDLSKFAYKYPKPLLSQTDMDDILESMTEQFETNFLIGGKGDDVDLSIFDPKEVNMGIDVEMEHTTDRKIAIEIVKDHLAEDPRYYSKLKISNL